MKITEIRVKSRLEIAEEAESTRRELLNIKFQWQSGETGNTAQRKFIKKKIARLKTVLREIDLGINKNLVSGG
ncbi:50S ribosomal protein L29 [Candidatus Kuenenia sp.]|uniref:50S ribosomal protein L29 n=1 Tax=Candidatus Kuenenia sp. TaxID=2499824 RepID=UPI00321FE9BE